jgi:hypothetical protein
MNESGQAAADGSTGFAVSGAIGSGGAGIGGGGAGSTTTAGGGGGGGGGASSGPTPETYRIRDLALRCARSGSWDYLTASEALVAFAAMLG